MQTLVTGGAGFIGSHLVDALVDRGDTVVVVDDLSKGRAERVNPAADLRRLDIRDGEALSALLAEVRPESVFHLAAQADVRVSVENPVLDAQINVLGTINLLEAARAVEARITFASTGGALYGETDVLPTPETEPVYPEAPYGTAKYCAEQYLGLYNRLHGTRHSILRLGNVYGPRQDPNGEAGVVSIFAGRISRGDGLTVFGDGTQTRDYVFVGDVVRAFLAAAAAEAAGVWNIGTGVQATVLDLIEGFAATTGRQVEPTFAPARSGELQRSALDVSKAGRELGFQAETSIRTGLERVYRWVEDGSPERGGLGA
jgi:UDP-glucose 4-epimerase